MSDTDNIDVWSSWHVIQGDLRSTIETRSRYHCVKPYVVNRLQSPSGGSHLKQGPIQIIKTHLYGGNSIAMKGQ